MKIKVKWIDRGTIVDFLWLAAAEMQIVNFAIRKPQRRILLVQPGHLENVKI